MNADFRVRLASGCRAEMLIDRYDGAGEQHLRYIQLTPTEYENLRIALKNDSRGSEEIDYFILDHVRESDFLSTYAQ